MVTMPLPGVFPGLKAGNSLHTTSFMSEQDEQGKPAPEEEMKIWVVCGVCDKVLQVGNIPGDKRTSHGLCKECSQKTLGEL